MGVSCDRLNLCSSAALDCLTGQNKGRYFKKDLTFLLVSLIRNRGLWENPKQNSLKHACIPTLAPKLLNWEKQKKNQDIMMMNNVIRHCPPQNFFSPYNSKLNQCTITKRKFPPMDDDEMPSSFELWRTQCTMGTNTFWIHIHNVGNPTKDLWGLCAKT